MIAISSLRPGLLEAATSRCLLHRSLHLKVTALPNIERTRVHLERSETCLSGDEDDVAHHKSSFDPSITNPEREFQTLDKECKAEGIIDPLLFSPCNMEISLILNEIASENQNQQRGDRICGSVNGWTRKGKLVHIENIPGGPFDRYEKLLEVLKNRASHFPSKFPKEDEYLRST